MRLLQFEGWFRKTYSLLVNGGISLGLVLLPVVAGAQTTASNAPVRVPVEKPVWHVTNRLGVVSATNRPPAVPQRIEVKDGEAVARFAAHQVTFGADFAESNALTLRLPEGHLLQGRIIGLAYTDTATGAVSWSPRLDHPARRWFCRTGWCIATPSMG
jgi:hypothetical protein